MRWQLRDKMHIDEFVPQINHWKWLWINQIDTGNFCLRDVFFLNVTCHSDDVEFVLLVGCEELTGSLGSFVSVHKRHHAVRQNKGVPVGVSFVDSPLNVLDQLLTIVATVNPLFNVSHAQHSHQAFDDQNIESFIINHQDLALVSFNFVYEVTYLRY